MVKMFNRSLDSSEIHLESFLVTTVPLIRESATIKDVLLVLEKTGNAYENVDYIYVINDKKNLVGMFPGRELFNNSKKTMVKKIMQRNIVVVSPKNTLEKIAHIALKHHLTQVPVVKSGVFLGVIPARKILGTINKALREDIFHFAGVHKSHLDFENSLEISLFKMLKGRLSWLIVGVLGAMLMAGYVSLFEETLTKYIIVASFIPAIVYISDALGTQVQTVFIRDLAVLGNEIKLRYYLLRQMVIAILAATIISIALFVVIALFWRVPFIGLVIALASFFSLIVTSAAALFITIAIKRFQFDPALGSGPIATIVSDITSIVIYFFVVVWLL